MKVNLNKKGIIILLLVVIAAWLVFSNIGLSGFSGTFNLRDEREWTGMTYSVKEGDADKFSAELAGPHKIKVKYNGTYEFRAEITLESATGETAQYELRLDQVHDLSTDSWQIESDLNEIPKSYHDD